MGIARDVVIAAKSESFFARDGIQRELTKFRALFFPRKRTRTLISWSQYEHETLNCGSYNHCSLFTAHCSSVTAHTSTLPRGRQRACRLDPPSLWSFPAESPNSELWRVSGPGFSMCRATSLVRSRIFPRLTLVVHALCSGIRIQLPAERIKRENWSLGTWIC